MEISVIVPIYNTEKYLGRCIDSIISQTFTDWELLLIDDGSSDKSPKICDEYAQKDSRIKVFHKKNEGVSLTRQYGLDRVETPYFIYCDSDDYVEPDYLECLINGMKENGSDIVVCAYTEIYRNQVKKIILPKGDYESFIRNMLHVRLWGVTWNKMYKTSIIHEKGIRFIPHIQMWEDLAFTIDYCMYTNKVSYVDKPLYHYVKTNQNSITMHENICKNHDRVEAVLRIQQSIINAGLYEIYKDEILWLKAHIKHAYIQERYDRDRLVAWSQTFNDLDKRYIKEKYNPLTYWCLSHNILGPFILIQFYRDTRFCLHQILKKLMR